MAERIFSFGAQPVMRAATVASLRAAKGRPGSYAQVTAETAAEAAAAEAAGIEMVTCRASNVAEVRRGSQIVFITAALGFAEAITDEEILRTAFKAVTNGADAVLTGRRLDVVELLASEDIPVVGHLGFVPRKSTWVGKVRGVGRDPDEAEALFHRFRRLEEAGAFAVEAELVSAPLLAEIGARTGLILVSLGSGPSAEVQFLFSSDICGETDRVPRHARQYADLAALERQMQDMRITALKGFRADVAGQSFPAISESIYPDEKDLRHIQSRLDAIQGGGLDEGGVRAHARETPN